MGNSQRAAMKAAALSAPPARAGGGRSPVRRTARPRRGEPQVKTSSVAVVLSLFLVLIVAAFLMGGRAVIDPLLQAAAHERESHRMGDIVMSTADRRLCRHLLFDNKTAEIIEGSVGQCPAEPARERRTARGFSWGAH